MAKMQGSCERYQTCYDGTVCQRDGESLAESRRPCCLEIAEACSLGRKPEERALIMLCKNQQTLLKRLLQTLKSYLKDPLFPSRPGYAQRKLMVNIIEQLQASIEDQKKYVLSVERDIQNFTHHKVMREILAENSHYRRLVGALKTEKENAEEQIKNLRKTNIIQTSILEKNKEGTLSVKVSQSSNLGFTDNQDSSKAVGLPDVMSLIRENNELKMKLRRGNREVSPKMQNLSTALNQESDSNPLKIAYQIGSPIIIDKSGSRINEQTTLVGHKGSQRVVSKQRIDMVYSRGKPNKEPLGIEKKRLEANLKDCKREMEKVRTSYGTLQQEMRSKQEYYNELKVTLKIQDDEIRELQREIEEFRRKLTTMEQSQQLENNQIPIDSHQGQVQISTEFKEYDGNPPNDWKRENDPQHRQRESWNVVHYRGSFEED